MAEEDALDKVLGDDPDQDKDDKDNSPASDGPSLEDQLKETTAKLEELEKSFKGQYGALKGEREQRQTLQGRMDEISNTLKDVMSKRGEVKDKDPEKISIPVDIDDDGNATMSMDVLSALIADRTKPIEEKIGKVETASSERDNRTSQEKDAQKTIDSIIAEDESFTAAHSRLTRIVSWLDDRIVPKLSEEGFKTMPSTGQILDLIEGSDIETAFEKQFPGVSMEVVVRGGARESKRDVRSALKHLGEEKSDPGKKDDKLDLKALQKIAEKGSNLADVRNQKDTKGLSLDQIASITPDDFLDASDEDVNKVMRLLEKDEQLD